MKPCKTPRVILLPLLVTVLFSLFFSACLAHKTKPDPESLQRIQKTDILNFPQSFRMVHRVRLVVRKRSYDFIGYLAINGSCCRAIAVPEIGGTAFDLLACGTERKALKRPSGLPVQPLKNGVLIELRSMFSRLIDEQTPGQTNKGANFFIKKENKTENNREHTSPSSPLKPGTPITLLLVEDGYLVSEIVIHSFCSVPGWSHPVPAKFTITNKV